MPSHLSEAMFFVHIAQKAVSFQRELTVNRMAWCKMPSSASGTSYGSSSGYGSSTNANNGSTKSLRNSPARMQSGKCRCCLPLRILSPACLTRGDTELDAGA